MPGMAYDVHPLTPDEFSRNLGNLPSNVDSNCNNWNELDIIDITLITLHYITLHYITLHMYVYIYTYILMYILT